jgi:hypothetical protein
MDAKLAGRPLSEALVSAIRMTDQLTKNSKGKALIKASTHEWAHLNSQAKKCPLMKGHIFMF